MENKAKTQQEMLNLNDLFGFLHTKGVKAKYNLVVETIKSGAKQQSQRYTLKRRNMESLTVKWLPIPTPQHPLQIPVMPS